MRTSAVFAVQRVDERGQQFVVAGMLAEADNVCVHLLLLEPFGQLHQFALLGSDRRTHEDNDPHLVVLALAMLEHELYK